MRCSNCGRVVEDPENYKTCNRCRDVATKRYYALKKEKMRSRDAGLCARPQCNNKVDDPKYKWCSRCRQNQKRFEEQHRSEKAAGVWWGRLCSVANCWIEVEDPKHRKCSFHRAIANNYYRNKVKGKAKEEGICSRPTCSREAEPGHKMCSQCLENARMNQRMRRDANLVAGVCVRCYRPLDSLRHKTCSKCRVEIKENYQVRAEARKNYDDRLLTQEYGPDPTTPANVAPADCHDDLAEYGPKIDL